MARKGVDVLLAAAEMVEQTDFHVLIVGQRYSQKDEAIAYEEQLRRRGESGRLRGRVHFLGRRSDTPDLLRELQLLVHPARQEPLGRVLLEGAAAGRAVIATSVGGTAEIFDSQAAAALVPPNDHAALAAATADLLSDQRRCRSMGQAARAIAVNRFSAAQATAGLQDHYAELLE